MRTNPNMPKPAVKQGSMFDRGRLCKSLFFGFVFCTPSPIMCSNGSVWTDNPTTRQPAGTNYQHVYDGLQAVENAPAPNFPVSEPLEPLSCASLLRWIDGSSDSSDVFFDVFCFMSVLEL